MCWRNPTEDNINSPTHNHLKTIFKEKVLNTGRTSKYFLLCFLCFTEKQALISFKNCIICTITINEKIPLNRTWIRHINPSVYEQDAISTQMQEIYFSESIKRTKKKLHKTTSFSCDSCFSYQQLSTATQNPLLPVLLPGLLSSFI